jgi:hypothetical protein
VADIAITAYWSASRSDILTTNWGLDKVNEHGGNYSALGVVGYLQSQPNGSWASSIAQVPLQLSYSSGRADAITGPMNAADVNALPTFAKEGGGYLGKQHVVGFGAAGSCPICNTTLAAAYPSLGGADCPLTCAKGSSSFTSIYPVGTYSGGSADAFRESMLRAGTILRNMSGNSKNSNIIKIESGSGLYVHFF